MQFSRKFRFEYSIRNVITTFLTFVLLFGLTSFPTIRAENVYTPVYGTQLYVEKYLVFNNDIDCPNLTFDYLITPGEAIVGTKDKQDILSGSDEHVSGSPTISSAVFTKNSQKYTSAQHQRLMS